MCLEGNDLFIKNKNKELKKRRIKNSNNIKPKYQKYAYNFFSSLRESVFYINILYKEKHKKKIQKKYKKTKKKNLNIKNQANKRLEQNLKEAEISRIGAFRALEAPEPG